MLGVGTAMTSNAMFGLGRSDITSCFYDNIDLNQKKAFAYGQLFGDIGSMVLGIIETNVSTGSLVLTGGISAPVSAPLALHGISQFVYGAIGVGKSIETISRLEAEANDGISKKPHGAPDHNQEIDNLVNELKRDPNNQNIRKNQRQVDYDGNPVGRNAPMFNMIMRKLKNIYVVKSTDQKQGTSFIKR